MYNDYAELYIQMVEVNYALLRQVLVRDEQQDLVITFLRRRLLDKHQHFGKYDVLSSDYFNVPL